VSKPSGPERTKSFARRPNGPRIYFEVSGPIDAPPLLLIRGLARSSSYWLEFRDILEQSHRLVVLDNRGVGRSDVPSMPWTTADMADDVAAVLAESGVQRADVFGISLGGMVAQQLALRHPHRIRKLVLACTTPGGKDAIRISPRAALALVRAASMPFEEGLRASAPWVLSEEALTRRPEIVDLWIAIASSEPRSTSGVLAQLLAAARHDASRMLRYIEHPTLVVTGDADRLLSPENSGVLAARLPNAKLVVLPGAGHDFPTERPDETARIVRDFVQ
jgi:3-oxoadipate enol-lactonase